MLLDNIRYLRYIILILLVSSSFGGSIELSQDQLFLYHAIPFVGILLSIALVPLVAPHFWHNNFGKISTFWLMLFTFIFIISFSLEHLVYFYLHTFLGEFVPFIALLTALYIISGGIKISGSFAGSPTTNTSILLIGTSLASFIGTTGSAMLLIRPIIKSNLWRKNNTHIIIFFIFLVANIGGSLSPLGDPPLFLGFLEGVPFEWPLLNMFFPMLFTSIILLILFFVIDTILYNREDKNNNNETSSSLPNFSLEGGFNLLLIVLVILTVYISGNESLQVDAIGHFMTLGKLFQVISLICLSVLSWRLTPMRIRNENDYTWFPIVEINKLFITIFITMIPVLEMLKAGSEGKLKWITDAVSSDMSYFWITGVLSALLDNAPTYLVFFKMAQGSESVPYFISNLGGTLLAISMGAVFMGAMTYIGNAPNFMVRSIAESYRIRMPSFFGYIIWSVCILIPIFLVVSILFI